MDAGQVADDCEADALAEALEYEGDITLQVTANMARWLATHNAFGELGIVQDWRRKSVFADSSSAHIATAEACERRGYVVRDVMAASDGRTTAFNITNEGRSALRRWARAMKHIVDAAMKAPGFPA